MASWIANGAELGWLVDPYEKCVRIYQPGQKMHKETALLIAGTRPVEGFTLNAAEVWGRYEIDEE